MRTGANGLAVLSAVHAFALPASSAGGFALAVSAAGLVLPTTVGGIGA